MTVRRSCSGRGTSESDATPGQAKRARAGDQLIKTYYREWSAKVPVLHPPRDEDGDARTLDLLDRFGNTIFVIGPFTFVASERPVFGQALRRHSLLSASIGSTRVARRAGM